MSNAEIGKWILDPALVLAAQDVHKSYKLGRRTLEVLRGVSLAVARGEFLALQGASGAGKSTLLHLLGGLDKPNQGKIQVERGELSSLYDMELAEWRNKTVGFVFQAYHLLPELDALENVCIPARMGRVSAREAVNRGRELLQRVGLGERMEHRPAELSGGEQQRVAIARSLINSPELLLADEPTGNLDSHTGEDILQLLLSLRAERNMTLIMATHDTNVAAKAPRTLHLVDGLVAEPQAK
jgi:ABC-type lipoprotein export system ATPase subunit